MNVKSILILSAFGIVGAANADLLSLYNFNDANTLGTSTTANINALLSADGGSLASTTSLTTSAATANVVSFAGTVTNASGTDARGSALAIQAGTNFANNGTNLTFSVTSASGTALSALNFSFAGQRTSTGFNSYVLSYSKNGGAFTNFTATPFDLETSFGTTTAVPAAVRSFNLSSLGSDVTSLSLRLTYTGATSTSGNFRLDNLQLNGTSQAVPEPATMAALGLGVAAMIRRRRSAK